jgi:DNA-binding transcriptional regulator YhcF (GntR family)
MIISRVMARARSVKISELKARLIARLAEGFYRPGDRFLSNRAVAAKFGVCYQTAHRLVAELESEGFLKRRPSSGTYVPGQPSLWAGAQLIFHPRARRKESFGSRLLRQLTKRLDAENIPWKTSWGRGAARLVKNLFPVIWECPAAAAACASQRRPGLLLNDRPPPGLPSVVMDSVSTDDFSGGVCAAQVLSERLGGRKEFLVLAGPRGDERSNRRVAGFLSARQAQVIYAGGWYVEDALRVASQLFHSDPQGIFCCNDRLAEGVLKYCKQNNKPRPPLAGFDDAPVAEHLNLTTMAIPWTELVDGAVSIIKKRLARNAATSTHQICMPRPLIRRL